MCKFQIFIGEQVCEAELFPQKFSNLIFETEESTSVFDDDHKFLFLWDHDRDARHFCQGQFGFFGTCFANGGVPSWTSSAVLGGSYVDIFNLYPCF